MDIKLAPAATARAEPDTRSGRSEYRILATNTSQIMLRILGLFAQQDLPLDRVRMQAVDDMIWLALTIDGLNRQRAQVIAAKLSALVDTDTVDLTWMGIGDGCRSNS